jgi:hypothetical protein
MNLSFKWIAKRHQLLPSLTVHVQVLPILYIRQEAFNPKLKQKRFHQNNFPEQNPSGTEVRIQSSCSHNPQMFHLS